MIDSGIYIAGDSAPMPAPLPVRSVEWSRVIELLCLASDGALTKNLFIYKDIREWDDLKQDLVRLVTQSTYIAFRGYFKTVAMFSEHIRKQISAATYVGELSQTVINDLCKKAILEVARDIDLLL